MDRKGKVTCLCARVWAFVHACVSVRACMRASVCVSACVYVYVRGWVSANGHELVSLRWLVVKLQL